MKLIRRVISENTERVLDDETEYDILSAVKFPDDVVFIL